MEETQTIQSLVRQLSQETAALLRHHLTLARLEIREGFSHARDSLLWLSAGLLLALIAVSFASVVLAGLLGELLGSIWLGFFVVAALWSALSIFLITDSLRALRSEQILPITQQQLQLDRQTLLTQTHDNT